MKLFLDDLVEDTRDPLLSFTIPGLDGDFGLFAPQWEIWRQLVAVSIERELPHESVYSITHILFFSRLVRSD